jgi:hypothetical protein
LSKVKADVVDEQELTPGWATGVKVCNIDSEDVTGKKTNVKMSNNSVSVLTGLPNPKNYWKMVL